ncbi:hypothetical protein LOK49_Contig14G00019 [Camellia lanceoleosa]|nr:hypothetical protein LOK49_Contig14G00019 [Camellia lanceoleosa]
MKFWDWYLKISVVSAMIGGSMEFFMLCMPSSSAIMTEIGSSHINKRTLYDKVTVLESEKRAWESSSNYEHIGASCIFFTHIVTTF